VSTIFRWSAAGFVVQMWDLFVHFIGFRYLEELSKRYRRQMEDMYSSLNRTITKLSNTAKIAEDKVCFLLFESFSTALEA
jgi:hypothetical protein